IPPTMIERALEHRGVRQMLTEALSWGRCFGGCVVYPGIEDGLQEDRPLDLGRVRRMRDEFEIYDARWARPRGNTLSSLADVDVFQLEDPISGKIRYVHRSRLLVTRGAPTGRRERAQMLGRDFSVMQRAYEPLRQFNQAYKSVELLMNEA